MAGTTFSIKNFERFQHYKDRNPPWIKLYNEILDDYEFGRLPDASKMHLVAIWLLASRSDNKLPFDSEWVGRRINATEPVDLEGLARAGFIVKNQELHIVGQDASMMQAECLSRDRERDRDRDRGRDREGVAKATPLPAKSKQPGNTRAKQLPEDWAPSGKHFSDGESLGFSARQVAEMAEDMRLWAGAKGATKKNWDMAFSGWIRREGKRIRPNVVPFPGVSRTTRAMQEILEEIEDGAFGSGRDLCGKGGGDVTGQLPKPTTRPEDVWKTIDVSPGGEAEIPPESPG